MSTFLGKECKIFKCTVVHVQDVHPYLEKYPVLTNNSLCFQSGQKGLADIIRVFGNGAISPSLQSINLSRNALGPDFDFGSDVSSLPLFSYTTNLDFSECKLNAKSCASCVGALIGSKGVHSPTTPRELTMRLNGNDLTDLQHFQQMMGTVVNSSIFRELHVSSCNIGDPGVQSLGLLECASSIQILDLSNNNLTESGIAAFTTSTCFSKLRKLYLAGNSFRDTHTHDSESTCSLLAAAIQKGPLTSLQELDVSQTFCGVAGARALLRCRQSSFTVLNLFGNCLGSDGFVALSKELEGGHPQLESLDLGGNEATEAGVVALLQALTRRNVDEQANKLRLLVVGGNQGGSTVERVVEDIKRIHPELDVARDKPRQNNKQQMSQTTWMAS